MSHAALMFQFPGESEARLAADTLGELGYEPRRHEGGRLHIHVWREDLTSALEIAQCFGGQLLGQEAAEPAAVTDSAYNMEQIPIPAHTVNEDWEEHYRSGEPEAPPQWRELDPDDGSYDRFDAT